MGTLALIFGAFFAFNTWESINAAEYFDGEGEDERTRREVARAVVSVVLALTCVISGATKLADAENSDEQVEGVVDGK